MAKYNTQGLSLFYDGFNEISFGQMQLPNVFVCSHKCFGAHIKENEINQDLVYGKRNVINFSQFDRSNLKGVNKYKMPTFRLTKNEIAFLQEIINKKNITASELIVQELEFSKSVIERLRFEKTVRDLTESLEISEM